MDIRIAKSLNLKKKAAFIFEHNYRRKVGVWPDSVSDEEIIRQIKMKEAKVGLA